MRMGKPSDHQSLEALNWNAGTLVPLPVLLRILGPFIRHALIRLSGSCKKRVRVGRWAWVVPISMRSSLASDRHVIDLSCSPKCLFLG